MTKRTPRHLICSALALAAVLALGRNAEAGTPFQVKDIRTGTDDGSPGSLTNVNGTLFFSGSDPVNGRELWKSDGTAAGTVLVRDIRPGTSGSSPSGLTNVNGTLFFAVYAPPTSARRSGRATAPPRGRSS